LLPRLSFIYTRRDGGGKVSMRGGGEVPMRCEGGGGCGPMPRKGARGVAAGEKGRTPGRRKKNVPKEPGGPRRQLR
jgi:hypothetical protein